MPGVILVALGLLTLYALRRHRGLAFLGIWFFVTLGTTSSVVPIVFDSSTVMTPSLPTFSIASAMILPIVESLLAEIVPTCATMLPDTGRDIFLICSTTASTARSMPRLSSIGLAPATTFLAPSR